MLKNTLKSLLSNPLILRFGCGLRYIFCYHDISKTYAPHFSTTYSTTPEQFKVQIEYLSAIFQLVSLDRLVQGNDLPKNRNYAAITFDDGFYSVLENAFPLLKQKQIPFTIFLNAQAIQENWLWTTDLEMGKKDTTYMHKLYQYFYPTQEVSFEYFCENYFQLLLNKINFNTHLDIFKGENRENIFLNKDNIKFLHKEGVHFGSHTCSHPVLSKCNASTFQTQIENNNQYLESILSEKINHFAIPFGKNTHYNPEVLNTIAQFHPYIYSTNPNRIRQETQLFPRIPLTNESVKEIQFYLNRSFIFKYQL